MTNWYNYIGSDVVKELKSDIDVGLRNEQVELNRKYYGENIILNDKNIDFFRMILEKIKQPWIIVIIAVVCQMIYLKLYFYGIIMIVVLFFSILLNLLDEIKEKRRYKILKKMDSYYVDVIREGKFKKVLAKELVVGDIVFMEKDRIIPADLRIIDSDGLIIKETSVTGENFGVEKYSAKIEEKNVSLSEMKNIAFKSTVVIEGNGVGIVTEVGMNTNVGKIIKISSELEDKDIKFDYFIEKYINFFSIFAIVTAAVIIYIGISKGNNANKIIMDSVIIILSCIPFGIILISNLIMFLIKKILSKQKIYFRNSSVLKLISEIDTICIDKVGVISQENMFVSRIYADENMINVFEDKLDDNNNYERIMNIALLCNNAMYNSKTNFSKGDLVDIALIKFGIENSLSKDKLRMEQQRIFEIPFDCQKGITTTINKVEKKYRANVKGAVDKILERCTYIMKNGIEREITEEDIQNIKNADIEMSNESMQAVAFAYRNFSYEPTADENIESYLVFAGLIGFCNPLKEECSDALEYGSKLDIKPVIITDDSKLTTISLCKNVGLINEDENVLCGVEIDNMEEEEFTRNVEKVSAFSRVNSDHKLKIVKELKKLGHKVAVSGSKLTDLPYMENADINMVMGDNGNNSIKKLSDYFLLDSSFNKIVQLIAFSRQCVNSFIEVVLYIFTCTLSLSIYFLLTSAFNHKIIGTLNQVLCMQLINITILSVFLFLKYKKKDIERCSVQKSEVVIKNNMIKILRLALVMAVLSFLGLYAGSNLNVINGQTLGFIILSFLQLFLIFVFPKR